MISIVCHKVGIDDQNPELGRALEYANVCDCVSVTLLLVYKNNVGIFILLISGPAVKDKIMQPSVKSISTILNDLSRDVVRTSCLVVFDTENGLFHFDKGWWVIKFWDDRKCR